MTNYLSWGSVFMFSGTICAVLFQSVVLWAALYFVGVVCFFLAHRQEQHLFRRVTFLENQLRIITAKLNEINETSGNP